ncbi:protein of unknown function DUF1684 [Beutenbergia cavernae DSM 12333]|uniref:DUF1684 domain-containing protein n=1 Tax=Beutenbergia cavernae (strain ATCC BAA-8 / DSM 12333 / CCUG 43141 / JCM 11478 / NBRC 16432 / NCIMB 13614 / HKI 0122) TaxID=471853 RepID=C5C631_BEUC1|nr:DUF1684 domain-containing protein [Beutenbergia cavernae]ACQ82389.1 protein of unknown function DUF1684 [Beutenbergia cavernae DSM 12333]
MSTATNDVGTSFLADWEAWHAAREAELRRPHGWLSLTALHWLGTEPTTLDDLPGRWWYDDEGTWVEPDAASSSDGGAVLLDGVALTGRTRVGDASGAGVGAVVVGDRVLEILGRGAGNRGVRVRDPEAPGRTGFDGVPTFTPDPAWRLDAVLTPLADAERVAVGSSAERVQHVAQIIGHVRFTYDGAHHSLAVGAGGSIAFRDATSGRETFGLLRFLTVTPDDDGAVVLDFNRATNPPCAFSDYGTCPLPPPENVLPFAVTAGERTPTRPV